MKIKSIIFLFIYLISFSNISLAEEKNKIVLKIENQIITDFEVKNKILSTLLLTQQDVTQKNVNSQKERSLQLLIQHKLKKIELSNHDIKSDKNQINNYLSSISSNSPTELEKIFKNNNVDYQLFLEEIETQLKWQQLIYQIYATKIEIDENVIDQEVNNIINNKSKIEEFKISEIELILKNDGTDESRVSNLLKEIEENSFEKAAVRFSMSDSSKNNGDLGWVNGKSLSKIIYNIINVMEIGQISEPIRRQNTILLLKLSDKKTSSSSSINRDELKKKIINLKKNELFDLYSRSYLSKLRNTSFIEYK